MITEDYVSFEVAKLLKEKGFDKFSYYGWNEQLFDKEHPRNFSIGIDDKKQWISCHTHQMAVKWLREVHKVLIVIDAYHADHWEGYIDSFEISIYRHASTIIVPNEIAHHTDYTEAVEAALKYSLENLL